MPDTNINTIWSIEMTKAKQNMIEMGQTVKNVEVQVQKGAASAASLDGQLQKCGKSLLHIGKGGMIFAGIAIVGRLIDEYRKWTEHMDSAGQALVKLTANQIRLNQAAGAGAGIGGGAKGAAISKEMMFYGAAQGLMPEDTRGALNKLWGKMKHKTPEERERAGAAMLAMMGAGLTDEEAAKNARKADVVQRVRDAQGRAAGSMANESGAYEARRNEIARATVAAEAIYPRTEVARQEKVRGLDVDYARSLEAGQQQRAGYLLKEGKPLDATERFFYSWAAGDEDDWTKNRGNRLYHKDVQSFGQDLSTPRLFDDTVTRFRQSLDAGAR